MGKLFKRVEDSVLYLLALRCHRLENGVVGEPLVGVYLGQRLCTRLVNDVKYRGEEFLPLLK